VNALNEPTALIKPHPVYVGLAPMALT